MHLAPDFQQITRSKSVDDAIDSLADLESLERRLTRKAPANEKRGAPARDLAVVLDAGTGDGTPTLAGAPIKTAQAISAGANARTHGLFGSIGLMTPHASSMSS